MQDSDQIRQAVSALPHFAGQETSLLPLDRAEDATVAFEVRTQDSRTLLKIYREPEDASPLVRARYRSAAEAEALQAFGPAGLSPVLLWHGAVNFEGEPTPAVLASYPQGEPPGSELLPAEYVDLLLGGLKEIHSAAPVARLVSSTPRTLETWWDRAHEAYRDLASDHVSALPPSVVDVIDTLVHPIAADAQTHRRYWQSAHLTPVHGSPDLANLRFTVSSLTLVNWERFGKGDPALEVATWAGLLGIRAGDSEEQSFIDRYLKNTDRLLALRVEVYRRLWPFGYVLPLLVRASRGRLPESEATNLVECFTRMMAGYERPIAEIEEVRADMAAWLGLDRKAEP